MAYYISSRIKLLELTNLCNFILRLSIDVDYYYSVKRNVLLQELVTLMWFILELLIRVWSAGCRSRYQQLMGRLAFMRRPTSILGRCCHLLCFNPNTFSPQVPSAGKKQLPHSLNQELTTSTTYKNNRSIKQCPLEDHLGPQFLSFHGVMGFFRPR